MFRKLFDPDNALMITMSQITDCIFLSLFWFVCCVPLVTAGASTAALYDSVYHAFRKGSKHSWQRFWGSFRSNLKGSAGSSAVFLLILFVLVRGIIRLWNSAVYGSVSWMLFSAGAFGGFFLAGILSILFPMLSRFENPAVRLWGNTFRLGLSHPVQSFGLAAVNTLSAFLCLRYIFPLFFLPALACLIGTLFIEPLFRPFLPSEDAA